MEKAALVTDPAARAQAWANVDKMLVDQAVAVPEDFDNQANIESKDVAGVNELWNTGTWDLRFHVAEEPVSKDWAPPPLAAGPDPCAAVSIR